MEYDEGRELTRYVWDNYQHLFTEFEFRVGRAILGRAKAATSNSPQMAALLNLRMGAVGDTVVETALAGGPEAFRRRVRDRLLSEHGTEAFINRCPRCERVVGTPLARQCFWCSFDWHNARAEQGAAADRGNRH